MLAYKGYTGQVEFDADAGLFHGEVLDTRDAITFQGTTVEDLQKAFRGSVDNYLTSARNDTRIPTNRFQGGWWPECD